MAITVTPEFTEINDADLTTNWTNAQTANDDLKIEGGFCNTTTVSNTTKAMYHLNGTDIAMETNRPGSHFYIWINTLTAGIHDTKANGGVRVFLGSGASATSNYKKFYVDGGNTNVVGGWKCVVVNPSGTADATLGTYVKDQHRLSGCEFKTVAAVQSTYRNCAIDIMRYGTGYTVKGDGTTVASLADLTAKEDELSGTTRIGSYGVVTVVSGIYYLAGKIMVENAAAATSSFKETNKTIVFQDFPVATTFYEFKATGTASYSATIQFGDYSSGATSNGCTIQGAGSAVWNLTGSTYGHWKVYGCNIEGMTSAVGSASSEMRNTVLTNCGSIDVNGATISGCTFNAQTATPVLATVTEVANISNCTFNSTGTGYGMEITGTAANITISSKFNGYASSNGSTGNEAIFVNIASGSMEISYTGGGAQPSIRTAGATVTFATTSVTVAVKVKDATSGNNVPSARVRIEKASDNSSILTGTTDANGELSTSFSYTAATDIIVRVRRASTDVGDGTIYKPFDGTGQITASGYSNTISLQRD